MTPAMLGPYPVERELGRGGMGVVYLARDPKLNRLVAIKVIPDTLAANPENLARFEREARLLAAVNHPNIASIYSVEEAAGQRLLVMEYVAGENLSDRTRLGKIPVAESLDIARQIAAAVEAAHEAGIVHRDLKPGNVRITPDGLVKVLDFGLAKGGVTSNAELAQSPTLTYSPTGLGVILGTAGYMSPEQARGKPVDKRADVWAFGCVLFECLTGRKTFEGETVSDTIARILEREPPWADLPPATPPRVRDLLRRCLEKDLKKRQRDIGDVRIEIEEAIAEQVSAARSGMSSPSGTAPAPAPPPRGLVRRYGLPALFVMLGIAVGVGGWVAMFGESNVTTRSLKLSVNLPPNFSVREGVFTRDGTALLVTGNFRRPDGTDDPLNRVFLRPLDTYELTPIPGTEGLETSARSPNGQWLAVLKPVTEGSIERRIFKVAVDGKTPVTAITDWQPGWRDMLWLENDELIVQTAQSSKFIRIPVSGGAPTAPIAFDMDKTGGYPRFERELPDGRGVLMRVQTWGPRGFQQNIWALDTQTGKARLLIEHGASPQYLRSTGHLLFSRGSSVMAVRFDLSTLTPSGEAVPLFDGLRSNTWDDGFFEVSAGGDLIFVPGGKLGVDRRLVVVTPSRQVTPFIADVRPYEASVSVSPNGNQVAVTVPNTRGTFELWVGGTDRPGIRKAVTFPSADASSAYWSPDGEWLAFNRDGRDLSDGVYLHRADGTGEARKIMTIGSLEDGISIVDWPRDGSGVVIVKTVGGTNQLFRVPISATGEPGQPVELKLAKVVGRVARISPDGQLIAFEAADTSRPELYIAQLSGAAIVGQPLMITTGNGWEPRWTRDSKRLYFRHQPNRLMSIAVERTPLRATPPVFIHDLKSLRLNVEAWDILPDGRLLGIEAGAGEDDTSHGNIVLNWLASVRAKLPK